jgi:hypothetical protein
MPIVIEDVTAQIVPEPASPASSERPAPQPQAVDLQLQVALALVLEQRRAQRLSDA